MINSSNFKPAWWLKNPHLQTIWGVILRPRSTIMLRRERFRLADGDFIDLDWAEPQNLAPLSPIILVLHGLNGSIDSHYAKNLMHSIYNV